jgi:hypothetical protein
MTTITVLDSTGATQSVAKIADTGQAAMAASLPVALASDQFVSTIPTEAVTALPITQTPQKTWRSGFDAAVASGPDTTFMTAIANGSGIAVSQSGGSLLITSGTTAFSETILRSVPSWYGTSKVRYSMTLSQRIINCEVYVELVDVIGDGLTIVHTNSTTVVVTIPSNPFTTANVGQSIYIGAISVASSLNQRAAIASVSGNDVTFTGAGFAATGTGTCSLFGYNYHHVYYDGAVATSTKYATCRNGWASADTAVTINTTAAGHVGLFTAEAGKGAYFDQLSASSTTVELTQRGSAVRNVPEDQTILRIQIRMRNLATAPLSTTTATIGFIEVDQFVAQQMSLVGVEAMSSNQALPVQLVGSASTIGTVTTVSTVTALTTLANGQTAHSAASTGSPVRVSGRVNTAVDTTLIAGDASDLFMTTSGAAVVKPYAMPEVDWQATSGITPLATTTSTAVKAAGAAGVRNYMTGLQLYNNGSATATNVSILDGATVIWTGFLPGFTTTDQAIPMEVIFPTPLRGTAATAMNIQCGTTAASVFWNAQGYQAP